ncbi:MAG: flagellar biosynthesis protein FlhF [Planctomycetes bacterium]|nr:flagellar biosynthesis protein FlhF [Planctomycetota bacterium]
MELKTFSAGSMQEALQLVRRELGPEASVLHTREVRARTLFGLLPGVPRFEVTASLDVTVPSKLTAQPRKRTINDNGGTKTKDARSKTTPSRPVRLPGAAAAAYSLRQPQSRIESPVRSTPSAARLPLPLDNLSMPLPPVEFSIPPVPRDPVGEELAELKSLVEQLRLKSRSSSQHELPQELFGLLTDLIEADVSEELARELLKQLRGELPADKLADIACVRQQMLRLVQARIAVGGPIQVAAGKRRVVAVVGPTGVGKTTTIAKLAANFRLREKRKVGLVTIDTYRIAAVDQLRTYADIIDLPMEVVGTPREVRPALERLRSQELVLIDTAGRSPHDAVRIQELKAVLAEAEPDEVHLVLSSIAGSAQLRRTAQQFAEVGVTSIILTKLDEASSLGNLLGVLDASRPPLSYVTDGQNVPDDIDTADAANLAKRILGY